MAVAQQELSRHNPAINTQKKVMNPTEAIAVLRAVQSHHSTSNGMQIGFLMTDASTALGGLAQASETLTMLMMDGLILSEPVVMNGEVHTIYRVADATPSTSRSLH